MGCSLAVGNCGVGFMDRVEEESPAKRRSFNISWRNGEFGREVESREGVGLLADWWLTVV